MGLGAHEFFFVEFSRGIIEIIDRRNFWRILRGIHLIEINSMVLLENACWSLRRIHEDIFGGIYGSGIPVGSPGEVL